MTWHVCPVLVALRSGARLRPDGRAWILSGPSPAPALALDEGLPFFPVPVASLRGLWEGIRAGTVSEGWSTMPGEVLMALAQFAGQTVAAAAITDVWESARSRFARLLGRGDARKTQVADGWLAQTREQLAAAGPGAEVEQAKQAERWAGRFADLLDEDPGVEAELRVLVDEVAAQLPAGAVSAADHSLAAGRDVNILASGGGLAAGVVHGNVTLPGNPTPPGPAQP